MGWEKLENPKANASSLAPDRVKVVARAAMRNSRYITVKIGGGVAFKAAFSRERHNCHLMVGGGDERGQLAILLDDRDGKFIARKKKDGRYEITVTATAAAGRFQMEFPPFERDTKLVPMPNGPSAITFQVGAGFLTD